MSVCKTKKREEVKKKEEKKKSTLPSRHFSFRLVSSSTSKYDRDGRFQARRFSEKAVLVCCCCFFYFVCFQEPSVSPGSSILFRMATRTTATTDSASVAGASSCLRRPFSSSSPSSLTSSHLDDEDATFDVAIVGAGMVGLALAGELGE